MRDTPIHILLVEDNADDAELLGEILRSLPSPVHVQREVRLEPALERLASERFDAVLLDLGLPDSIGIDTFLRARNSAPHLPIIVLTGLEDGDLAIRALREGAQDYLTKDRRDPEMLYRSICYSIERKCCEEALKSSREKMKRVIESAPVGIRIVEEGKHTYVNPAFARLFGFEDPEDLIGLSVASLDASPARDFPAGQENRPEGQPAKPEPYQGRGVRKDGTVFDQQVWVTDIPWEKEKAHLHFVIDNSSEVKLWRQLLRAQKLEAIGTLAGGIAHDFNNILGVIMGYCELALLELSGPGVVPDHLGQIVKATNRARDLVRQILTFSQQTDQERGPLRLSPLIRESLKLLRPTLPSNIDIQTRMQTEAEETNILADPTQMHQVLVNLCTNAAHAMKDGGGRLTIGLGVVHPGTPEFPDHLGPDPVPHIRLSVEDTGRGIDKQIIERIFEPYFTTKDVGEGTGLGLSVVHGIVTAHHGHIMASSQNGVGSLFQVFLPVHHGEASPEHEPRHECPPLGGGSILFVDDEPYLVEVASQMLSHFGYQVTSTTDSREALDTFKHDPEHYQLVISDQMMPHLTGLELAEEMFRLRPNLPFILCTGYSEVVSLDIAREKGIRELVLKPLVLHDLAHLVQKVIEEQC